jgi:5-methylcytosine-specific restriction protein B
MTIIELSKMLSEMYENAPDGDKVAMIHLFGIRYSSEIEKNGKVSVVSKEIIKNTKLKNDSQMHESYDREIFKGLKLSKYVIDKETLYDKKISGYWCTGKRHITDLYAFRALKRPRGSGRRPLPMPVKVSGHRPAVPRMPLPYRLK